MEGCGFGFGVRCLCTGGLGAEGLCVLAGLGGAGLGGVAAWCVEGLGAVAVWCVAGLGVARWAGIAGLAALAVVGALAWWGGTTGLGGKARLGRKAQLGRMHGWGGGLGLLLRDRLRGRLRLRRDCRFGRRSPRGRDGGRLRAGDLAVAEEGRRRHRGESAMLAVSVRPAAEQRRSVVALISASAEIPPRPTAGRRMAGRLVAACRRVCRSAVDSRIGRALRDPAPAGADRAPQMSAEACLCVRANARAMPATAQSGQGRAWSPRTLPLSLEPAGLADGLALCATPMCSGDSPHGGFGSPTHRPLVAGDSALC